MDDRQLPEVAPAYHSRVISSQLASPLSGPGVPDAWARTVRTYVDSVRGLDQVQVILVDEDSSPRESVWTVIDAPEYDFAARYPVYDAQMHALATEGAVPLDFRVINVRELRVPLDDALPHRRCIAFQR